MSGSNGTFTFVWQFSTGQFRLHLQSSQRICIVERHWQRHGTDCDRPFFNIRATNRSPSSRASHPSASWRSSVAAVRIQAQAACCRFPGIAVAGPIRHRKLRRCRRRRGWNAPVFFQHQHAGRQLFRGCHGYRERSVSQDHAQPDGGLAMFECRECSACLPLNGGANKGAAIL